MCICFNAVALFLLWFLHSGGTGGKKNQSNRNIVLYQTGESFGDLKLNAAASSPRWETRPNGPNAATGGNLKSPNVHWLAINMQYSS